MVIGIIHHDISLNNTQYFKIVALIKEGKLCATLPYGGEHTGKTNVSRLQYLFTPVNILQNAVVHPKDKQYERHQRDVV